MRVTDLGEEILTFMSWRLNCFLCVSLSLCVCNAREWRLLDYKFYLAWWENFGRKKRLRSLFSPKNIFLYRCVHNWLGFLEIAQSLYFYKKTPFKKPSNEVLPRFVFRGVRYGYFRWNAESLMFGFSAPLAAPRYEIPIKIRVTVLFNQINF